MTYSELSPWPLGADPNPAMRNEGERLVTLASYSIEDLSGDEELARLAQFAAHLCGTPSAAVSLVEAERQVFLASEGMAVAETPRETSLCAHAMLTGDVLEVRDASEDPRFAKFALVTGEAHLRFYAGAPLISSEGAPLGALCVTDTEPRPEGLTPLQSEGLLVLADAVKRRLLAHRQSRDMTAEIRSIADRLEFMIDSVPDIAWSATAGARFDYVNARWRKVTGLPAPRDVEDWRDVIHPDEFESTSAKFLAAIEAAEPFEDEWRMRQADGSYRWVLSRAVPSSDNAQTARWFGTLTDIDVSRRAREERELVAGELAHRIKNIFSVIIGLVSLHARGDAAMKVFADALSENIRALSRAQEFALQLDRIKAENLKGLLEQLLAPYGLPGTSPVTITGDDALFGARAATPLALVFHELATNSAKYGALGTADGTVAITLSQNGDNTVIDWREDGGPATQPPESTGFGSRLMTMAIQNQLGGELKRVWSETGLQATILVPQSNLEK